MIRISVKKKIDCTVITHKIEKNEQINSTELKIIHDGEIVNLLPCEVKKGIVGTKIVFSLNNLIDVASYLRSGISFADFVDIMMSVVETIRDCKARGIRVSNLETRPDTIYFSFTEKSVKMLYWPLISLQDYSDERNLFIDLLACYQSRHGDEEFRNLYESSLMNKKSFDIYVLERNMQSLKKRWKEKNESNYIEEGPPIGNDSNDFDRTISLTCPTLLHISSNKRIELQNTSFVIGRSYDQSDYVIENNTSISRKHAVFTRDGSAVYIRDNYSVNGIQVDGEAILVNENYKLKTGQVISIGGEEFIFFGMAGK